MGSEQTCIDPTEIVEVCMSVCNHGSSQTTARHPYDCVRTDAHATYWCIVSRYSSTACVGNQTTNICRQDHVSRFFTGYANTVFFDEGVVESLHL